MAAMTAASVPIARGAAFARADTGADPGPHCGANTGPKPVTDRGPDPRAD